MIIAITHLGDGYVPCSSKDLANALTGEYQDSVDVIIDGHSHTVENETVNEVLVVQTGSNMSSLGELTLQITEDDVKASQRLIDVNEMNNVTPKAEVTDKLKEIQESQSGLLEEEIGETPVTFWAGWIGDIAMTRLEETNFGDLSADAFREAAEDFTERTGTKEEKNLPVIAVENGGGIREAVRNGRITAGDLMTAFPFSNTLYLKKVTPAILYEVMEVSGSALDGQDKDTGMLLQQNISGGFLQISGFRVVYDPDGTDGNKVTSITLEGESEPLDRNDNDTQIIMVSNNYIMSGGNDYTMLASLPKYGEAGGELEVIQAYVEKCLAENSLGQYARVQGRILMRGNGYVPGMYTVYIKVVDEAGNPAADTPLSYRVDAGTRINGVTNENGMLAIMLSEGGHGIRLADSQDEVYVSNYSGIGLMEDQIRNWPELTFLADGSCNPVEDEQETEKPQLPNADHEDAEAENPAADTDVADNAESSRESETVSTDMEAPETSDGGNVIPAMVLLGAGMCGAWTAGGLRRKVHD